MQLNSARWNLFLFHAQYFSHCLTFFALHSCYECICPVAHFLLTVVNMLEAAWWVLQCILIAAYQYLRNLNLHE